MEVLHFLHRSHLAQEQRESALVVRKTLLQGRPMTKSDGQGLHEGPSNLCVELDELFKCDQDRPTKEVMRALPMQKATALKMQTLVQGASSSGVSSARRIATEVRFTEEC